MLVSCGQPSETGFSIQGGQGSNQVTICHRPPGNPENVQTITVGESAVDAHLAHQPLRPLLRVCRLI